MKKLAIALGVMGLAYAGSTLPFSVYSLHKTESAVEKRGDIVAVSERPGPHLKNQWYVPVWGGMMTSVEKIDNRLREYVDSSEEVMTADHKFVRISRYCKWKVTDPEKFINSVGTDEKAQTILDDLIFSKVWSNVGQYSLKENQITKRGQIRHDMIKQSNDFLAQENYGIEIDDLRIVKFNLSEKVRPDIYKRMISEQTNRAEAIKAKGREEVKKIDGKREEQVQTFESEGRQKATELIGTAQRKVAALYDEANEDPDFFNFYQSMETYKSMAKANPKFVLSTDNALFNELLNGGDLKPEDLEALLQKKAVKQDTGTYTAPEKY